MKDSNAYRAYSPKKLMLAIAGFAFFTLDKIVSFLSERNSRRAFNPLEIRNILVIGLTSIGNTIMFTPVLRHLKRCLPDATITFLQGGNKAAELIAYSPFIDRIITFNFKNSGWIERFKFMQQLRQENFDATVTVCGGMGYPRALIALSTGVPLRVGHEYEVGWYTHCGLFYNVRLSDRKDQHEVENNLDLLQKIGLTLNDEDNKLFAWISEDNKSWAKQFLDMHGIQNEDVIIGMHVGSDRASKGKRWPVEKFARLADKLYQKWHAKIILFFGPDEYSLIQSILDLMDTKPVIASEITLKQTAALIQHCTAFVCSDSGLGHIAAALQVPTVAIFGPADPVRFRPYGSIHKVVRKQLECSPCWGEQRFFDECMQRKCLLLITVDDVFETLNGMLEGSFRSEH